MRLTKRTIDGFKYQGLNGGRDVRWDDTLPGFGVRIYPNGKKSFVLSYRYAGRKHLIVVGKYGVYTLDEARSKAKKYLTGLENTDPLEVRKVAMKAGNVATLCKQYLDNYAKPHKKSWRKDESRINRHILPQWGNQKVHAITNDDICVLHKRIGGSPERPGRPYEANRTLELLKVMFKLSKEWGYIPDKVLRTWNNPAAGVKAYEETKRDRWIRPHEVPRLSDAIDAESNPYVRAAFWLYLLTGLRKTELLQSKWENLDWERRELRIDGRKNEEPLLVPLSPPVLELLRDLPRADGNPYVLSGHITGRPLVNVDKAWRRIRNRAGVNDVRIHDLRRTVGSWLATSGKSLLLIGKVLGHKSTKSTEVYARLAEDAARKALESHGKQVIGLAGKSKPVEVVEINKQR